MHVKLAWDIHHKMKARKERKRLKILATGENMILIMQITNLIVFTNVFSFRKRSVKINKESLCWRKVNTFLQY